MKTFTLISGAALRFLIFISVLSISALYGNSLSAYPVSIETDTLQGVVINPPDANGRFGQSVSDAGDVNADGYGDIIIGAVGYPYLFGKALIYFGGPVIDTSPDLVLTNGQYFFGGSVSKAGDVNGDGYSDVIVGVGHYVFAIDAAVYIYFGGQNMNNTADVVIPQGGKSVSCAGDVNNDGFDDVITSGGYIYFGGTSMDNIPDVVTGGYPVSDAGDVNNDGYDDVIVAAAWPTAHIFLGGMSMDNVPDLIINIQEEPYDFQVSDAGDVNGDGFDDVMCGTPEANPFGRGKIFVYFGGQSMDNIPDIILSGTVNFLSLGYRIACAGDVNGDGYSDIVTGTWHYNTFDSYLFYGGTSMSNTPDAVMRGSAGQPPDMWVSSAGDFDGDGVPEILIGIGASNYPTGVATLYKMNPFPLACNISGPSNVTADSSDILYYSDASTGMWTLTNSGNTRASIVSGSNDDSVVVNTGTAAGQFNLVFASGDTIVCNKYVNVDIPYPVEISVFSYTVSGSNAILFWHSVSENNNAGFAVERKKGSGEFAKAGYVRGSNEPSDYSFTDPGLETGIYHYRLKQIDFNGNFEYYELPVAVTIGVPDKFFLDQNYPNPFNPVTTIGYGIPQAGNVSVKVFDMSGREVVTLVGEFKDAGYYTVKFDGSSLASGTYIYRLEVSQSNPNESGRFVSVKKAVLLK